MKDRIPFAVNNITCVILLSLFCNAASAVEFNTDVLDAADKKNIDFTRFSEAGYVLPGQYLLDVIVNGQSISPASLQISFVEPQSSGDKAEKKLPQACLTSDMVRLMGLTAESLDKVVYWHDGQCADFHGLPEWIFVLIPERAYYASICRRPGLSILMPPGCLPHAGRRHSRTDAGL